MSLEHEIILERLVFTQTVIHCFYFWVTSCNEFTVIILHDEKNFVNSTTNIVYKRIL